METRRIGKLEVSVIGLGCNNFGWKIDEKATRDVIDAAIASGINFLDTSDTYGKTTSEEFIGRALEGRRDECDHRHEIREAGGCDADGCEARVCAPGV